MSDKLVIMEKMLVVIIKLLENLKIMDINILFVMLKYLLAELIKSEYI